MSRTSKVKLKQGVCTSESTKKWTFNRWSENKTSSVAFSKAEVRLQGAAQKIQDCRAVSDTNCKNQRRMGMDTSLWALWFLWCVGGYLILHFIIKKQIAIKAQEHIPRQINRCSFLFLSPLGQATLDLTAEKAVNHNLLPDVKELSGILRKEFPWRKTSTQLWEWCASQQGSSFLLGYTDRRWGGRKVEVSAKFSQECWLKKD